MSRIGGLLARLRKEAVSPSTQVTALPNTDYSGEDNVSSSSKDDRHGDSAIEIGKPNIEPNQKQIRHMKRRNRQRLKRNMETPTKDDVESLESEEDIMDCDSSEYCTFQQFRTITWFKVTKDNPNSSDCLRSAKWSPTGDRIVTCSEDNGTLRIYHSPGERTLDPDLELRDQSSMTLTSQECIYDYAWYPYSSLEIEKSSLIAVTARSRPLNLLDACDGSLRAVYRSTNYAGMVSTPHSLCFSLDGSKLIAGFDSRLHLFHVDCPGTVQTEYFTKSAKRSSTMTAYENTPSAYTNCFSGPSQVNGNTYNSSGIISSLVVSPTMPGVFGCGTFSGQITLFDEAVMKPVAQVGELEGGKYHLSGLASDKLAGITQLKFSPQGQLFAGFRNSNFLQCYDMRNLVRPLWTVERASRSNQRIGFDLDASGAWLASGGIDGKLKFWSVVGASEPHEIELQGDISGYENDGISSVQFHPYLPCFNLTTGKRRFQSVDTDSESDEGDFEKQPPGLHRPTARPCNPLKMAPRNHLVVGYLSPVAQYGDSQKD